MRMYNLDLRGLRLLTLVKTTQLVFIPMRMYNLDLRGLRLGQLFVFLQKDFLDENV